MKILPPRKTPNKDDRYMALAFTVAGFSKDPRTQVGAIIVADGNYPLGFGYNGPPREIDDYEINWARPHKYPFIDHAEENAIEHSDKNKLPGSTLYVTAKPCPGCMRKIIRNRIEKVIYYPSSHDGNSSLSNDELIKDTDELIRLSEIVVEEFDGNLHWIRDHIMNLNNMGIFN